MANVIFKRGTRAQYDALLTKNSNTIYWLKDTQEVFLGDVLFGVGREASAAMSGLLSAADKEKLDSMLSGTTGLVSVDKAILLTDNEDGTRSIGINLSAVEGNTLTVLDDGLYVPAPTIAETARYTLERQDAAEDGYSASYKLKETIGESTSYVGDVINIPKDMVLQSGTMEKVVEAGSPYDGAEIGDPYIDLVLSDPGNSHVYISVKGLVDTVYAGYGVTVENNTVSLKLSSVEARGLFVSDDGLGLALATRTSDGAMSAADKLSLDSIPYAYKKHLYEITNKPDGSIVDYREKEIRLMCAEDTEWSLQSTGEGGDSTKYYIGLRAYAPLNEVVGFKETIGETITDDTVYSFDENEFAGTDEFGRKYSIIWLPVASYDADTSVWTYYGDSSSTENYIGWYYTVEWYDENGEMLASDLIRINLTNKDCHHAILPSYMTTFATDEDVASLQEAIAAMEAAYSWAEM